MIEIIYEDEHIVVVLKPKGMLSQPDQRQSENLYDLLLQQLSVKSLGMVQRLDRPVGGLMVFGKSLTAKKKLLDLMQQRLIHKTYLALVDGCPEDEQTLINFIQKVRGNRAVVSNKKTSSSKEAVLSYKKLLEPHSHPKGSLIAVELKTGRFHQIRAQLAHNKTPIVGDTKYNAHYQKLEGWHNIGLYAYKLSFPHPVTSEQLVFERYPLDPPFI